MVENVTALRVPDESWAQGAAADLAQAECQAEALAGPDSQGCHTLLVRGSREQIAALRAASEPRPGLCWMTLVNRVLAGR